MTATAICMRCGVFACVYPPLFFPHDITTTSMLPTTTNQDCEGWGGLDGDFGRMWWFGGAEQATRSKSLNTEQIPDLAQEWRCRDCRLRLHTSARNHHTGIRFDREARYEQNGCSLVLRAENCMRNVAEADSCKIQVSCACESAGLNYVVKTVGRAIEFNFNTTVFPITGSFMHLLASNTAAKNFFGLHMTEWVKEDGGCNMYRAWQGMYRAWNVWGGTSFVNPVSGTIGENRGKKSKKRVAALYSGMEKGRGGRVQNQHSSSQRRIEIPRVKEPEVRGGVSNSSLSGSFSSSGAYIQVSHTNGTAGVETAGEGERQAEDAMESSEDIVCVGIGDGERLGRRETRLSDSMIVGNRSFLKPNWMGLRSYDDGRVDWHNFEIKGMHKNTPRLPSSGPFPLGLERDGLVELGGLRDRGQCERGEGERRDGAAATAVDFLCKAGRAAGGLVSYLREEQSSGIGEPQDEFEVVVDACRLGTAGLAFLTIRAAPLAFPGVLGLLLLGHENVRLAFLFAQPTPDVGGTPTRDGLIYRSWRR
ncbi:hypothetical protein DFH08DRAFT_944688 [Mycena albidolilacea]|uniref:Uncharacterized protein n=1 Tax=Mycena albidolilacea TaxID=1033008 RepID=A0AAD6Z4F3_9AGAR|nr:hypothetical protein DFH08DRAFT_944688 [Mycena albidolilacea]